MSIRLLLLAPLFFLLLFGWPSRAAGPLLISEFMASNSSGLTDEDGEFSDWIEIYNAGAITVDLANWSLTDDATSLTKWRFPATNLPPGRFLLVFASNKNRRLPGAPLHTNFRLSGEGEYLALVQPDGTNVVHQFAPLFPPQNANTSYGLAATGTNATLISTGSTALASVPLDGSLGLTWIAPGFNDTGWIRGATGVGYERASGYESLLGLDLLSSSLPAAQRIDRNGDGVNDNTSVYVRIPFALSDPASFNTLRLRMRHDDGFVAYLNGHWIAADNELPSLQWNSRAESDYGDVTDVMIAIVYGPGNSITLYRNGVLYAAAANATTGSLQTYPANVAQFLMGKRHSDLGDGGTAGGADGFLAGSINEGRVYGAPLSAADIQRLHAAGPLGGTNPPPAAITTNLLHLWSFNDGTARDSAGIAHGSLLNGATIDGGRLVLDGINDYLRSAPLRTNLSVRTLMVWVSLENLTQQAGSALTVENPTGADIFDGIIYAERVPQQWMNGSSNFQRSVGDNGGPAETVVETAAADFVAFDVSAHTDKLVAGGNVLAVHGLNYSLEDSDLLILPELIGGVFTLATNQTGYFDQPTPGGMNRAVFQRLFADVGFSHERGYYAAPFSLVLTAAAANVTIRYTLDGSPPSETNGVTYIAPIPIHRTGPVRAAAFRPGYTPASATTHTYVFAAGVLRQSNSAPAGAHWDTEMDPQVVNNSNQTWTAAQGLVDLPTLSIVMANGDLFGPNGIYANPTARGDEWERAASVEYFYPEEYAGHREGRGFAIQCGIQINGNFSRLTHQPKHSFRLVFKETWGAAKLNYPLFENYDVTEFDTLLVACGHNQGWATGIANSQFLRNRFSWDLEGAEPGRAYVHSRTVHLYLNGIYWGLFDLGERPDESFSAANFGGAKEEYDVFKGLRAGGSTQARIINGTRDAWAELFALAARDLTQPTNYAGIERLVDLDQFIDYSIGILYTADRDGPTGWLNGPPNSLEPKNFYATRRRTPDGRFRFWRWDSEFILENENEDVSERNGFENPGRLHFNLRANAEYRLRFADRVQQLCFQDGPFTTAALTNRYLALAAEIDKAVVTESARWGDAKREPPFTRDLEWVAERNRIVNTYLPRRLAIFLSQLRADGLFPAFSAPNLNINGTARYGGEIVAGNQLSLTATNGQIYYTLDGTDPRRPGGAPAPNALLFTGPLTLADSVVVKARVFSNGQWSALAVATFYLRPDWSKLLLTEIMYNPPALGTESGEEFEFLELKNAGTTVLPLEGLTFKRGIRYRFPRGTLLAPGEFFLLARNASALPAKYPGINIGGVYDGNLDNTGDALELAHASQGTVLQVTYGDSAPWPATPDRHGFSLVPRDPNANADPDHPMNWRASTMPGGSPGADDPASLIPPIKINEVLSASTPPLTDTIELFNPTGNGVNVGGWFLTDDRDEPRKFRLPEGTVIPARGLIVFDEATFNAAGTTNDFALSSRGDQVYLFAADLAGNLTGYDHGLAFDAAADGVSFGRHLISTGEEQFPAQIGLTPGATNVGPRIGPVVITEILYHPAAGVDEFVELQNISSSPVLLFDPLHTTNTWRLSGLGYTFPRNLVLAPGERLLVVPLAPAEFRARYNVAADVQVIGPFTGGLQNDGELLQLQRPGLPDADGVPFITVDHVRYNDRAPWPLAADGAGPSLQRVGAGLYGNDPIHWTAATPTLGIAFVGGQAPQLTAEPASLAIVAHLDAAFSVAAAGAPPLAYQWQFNGSLIPGATSMELVITNVQPRHAGRYRAIVFNAAGSAVSSNAQLSVRIPAVITQQPTNRTVSSGANVTFFVSATGQGPLRYQWRFNGVNLPGQTNATLTLNGVQPAHEGAYMVIVTDDVGATPSQTAFLTVLVRPTIIAQPQSQTVLEGGTATFHVTVTGTLPMTYRWRRNGVTQLTIITNLHTSDYTIPNVQMSHAGTIAAAISNPGGVAPVSSNAMLIVLADFDRDGMGDLWEASFGFSTNSAADASLDVDGDRMLNRHEFVAGTDPTDPQSYLRVTGLTPGGPTWIWFEAVSNRTYRLEFKDGLDAGAWTTLTTVPAYDTNRTATVTDSGASPSRFYRLVIP